MRVAVEFGVEAANCFDLGGQGLVTQKSAFMRERDPELPDVAQRFAMYWKTVILSARSQSAAFSHGST